MLNNFVAVNNQRAMVGSKNEQSSKQTNKTLNKMNNKLLLKGSALPATLFCTALMLTPPFYSVSSAKATAMVVQQTGTIKGTVVDSNGEAVIGASVVIVGQNAAQGTVTDFDGNFILDVKPGTKLKISYIGFETQTVVAKNGMQVIMKEDNATNLKAVEVVAYGVQKKVTVTGAISSIKGDELTKVPTSSVANVLAGAVSGISTIQYSGLPGEEGANQIYLRGKGTWGDSTPLIQIDGVTREMSDFTQMDPNDIESVSVLKDASATAVFGVQGANGVILITTKRGKEGKAKVSFTSTNSIVMPTKTVELANSYQYATFYNKAQMYDGAESGVWSDYAIERFRTGDDPLRFPSTDWMDYIMKKSTFQTQNNVSITGGTNKVRYYVSAGFMTQGGLFKEYDQGYHNDFRYKRFNYRANVDMNVTKTTKVTLSLSGKLDDSSRPNSGGQTYNTIFRNIYYSTPFSSPGIVDGKVIALSNKSNGWNDDEQLAFVGGNGLTSYYGTGAKYISSNSFVADVSLDQNLDFITKGLTFKLKGAYNSWYSVTKELTAEMPTYTPKLKEDGTIGYSKSTEPGPQSWSEGSPSPGRNWYFEASFNWQRDFGLHHLSALALYNQRKEYYPSSYSSIPHGLVGVAARVTYDWNTRYLAEFNMGYNGSENFPENKRFGFFPAASLGWILSEEPFWKKVKPVVSYMKLRATWGLVGNDKPATGGRFLYTPDSFSSPISNNPNRGGGYAYPFGGITGNNVNGIIESAKHNQNVTWEKSLKQNYGVDIYFLNDRFRTTFDYYYEKRSDILLSAGIYPSILGFTPPVGNAGKVNSWGYELTTRWQDKIGPDFRYWVGANLSYNQNEVIERMEAPQEEQYMYLKGHRIGSRKFYKFYKYYYDGIEADYEKEFGQPFPKHTTGVDNGVLKPGDATYVDMNGDGVIDSKDSAYGLSNSYTDDPEYTLGVNLGFSYKNWSFSMQWTSAWNTTRLLSDIFVKPFTDAAGANQGGLLIYQYENSWSEENPSQDALYPRPTFASAGNNYASSTLYEKDASYLRLKSFQLAYDFKFPWMQRIKLNTLQVSLSGYNVLTFTSYKWGDPESKVSNAPTYPLTRSFALGLKVGF